MQHFDPQIAKDQRKAQWNSLVSQLEKSLISLNKLDSNSDYPQKLEFLRGRIRRYSDGHDYQAITQDISKLRKEVQRYEQEKEAKAIELRTMPPEPITPAAPQQATIPAYLRENRTQSCCPAFFKKKSNAVRSPSSGTPGPQAAKRVP